MNVALQEFLNDIQELCQEMAPEPSMAAMLAPSHLREKCRQEASDMVARNNIINDKAPTKMNQLVTDLTALMLQVKVIFDFITAKIDIPINLMYIKSCVKWLTLIFLFFSQCLSDSDRNAYELKVLQGTMEQIRSRLTPQNEQVFQNCVEVHMQRIQLGLGQIGALTPFMAQKA